MVNVIQGYEVKKNVKSLILGLGGSMHVIRNFVLNNAKDNPRSFLHCLELAKNDIENIEIMRNSLKIIRSFDVNKARTASFFEIFT